MLRDALAWRSAKTSIHQAAVASHAALNPKDGDRAPPIGGKQLRTVAADVLNGKHVELLSQYGINLDAVIAAVGTTRDEVLARAVETPEQALVRDGVRGAVRARMTANHTRHPLPSDPVDLEHLRVLQHVDIFLSGWRPTRDTWGGDPAPPAGRTAATRQQPR